MSTELLECPPGELGANVEADGDELIGVGEGVGARGGEREVVADIKLLRGDDVLDGGVGAVVAAEVDVLGGPRSDAEAEVQREGALENPPAGSDGDEPAQEELERHALA